MTTPDADTEAVKAIVFDSIEDFLAHAVTMEDDAADRYDELADAMEVHHNEDVAELFRKLGDAGRKHAASMRTRAQGKDLPRIQPWDFKWPGGEAPEMPSHDDVHYLMTPFHGLQIARGVEVAAHAFYQGVADGASDTEVRLLAKECAEEEAVHVDLLDRWMVRYPEPGPDWDDDPDPPIMPE